MRWHTKNIHRMLVAQQPLKTKSTESLYKQKKAKPVPIHRKQKVGRHAKSGALLVLNLNYLLKHH